MTTVHKQGLGVHAVSDGSAIASAFDGELGSGGHGGGVGCDVWDEIQAARGGVDFNDGLGARFPGTKGDLLIRVYTYDPCSDSEGNTPRPDIVLPQ